MKLIARLLIALALSAAFAGCAGMGSGSYDDPSETRKND
jgi:hypothetical protein